MAFLKDTVVAGDLRVTDTIYGKVPLADLVDADDLKAIEALTGTSGTLTKTAANTWALSSGVTPASHTHGNIQNGGTLQTNDISIANGDKIIVTDSSDSNKIARTSISFDGSTTTKALTQKGTWETFNNYSHPTGDGNLHVPATGTSNNGKVLKAGSTAGSISWGTLSKSDVGLGNVANTTITVTSNSVSDGTTTFNKYTHPTTSGNKHIPSGGSSGQFLGWDSDGTAKWVANPNANYYHKTGSWSGLTYTAAKVGSPDDLAFTIPTGTTSTTVAVGNHTHTTTLTSGGTATVNLAANTAYTLTAGGTSVIFKTPADGNTDTKVNVVARGTTKTYLLGDTTAPTSSAAAHTAVAETGIYMTTIAGQINATTYKVNEAVTLQYTTATKSLDFIFA